MKRNLTAFFILVLIMTLAIPVAGLAADQPQFGGSGAEGPAAPVPPHTDGGIKVPVPNRPPPPPPNDDPSLRIPSRLIVVLKSGLGPKNLAEVHQQTHGKDTGAPDFLRNRLVDVPVGTEAAAKAMYEQNPNVESVEYDIWAQTDCHEGCGWYPNDTYLACNGGLCDQYYEHNGGQVINGVAGLVDADIDAPEAWNGSKGSYQSGGQWVGTKIAILDTGIQANHPDLAGKIAYTYNFHAPGTSADDLNGHGTAMAGVAAATTNNATGVAGVCPDCSIYALKVSDDTPEGQSANIDLGAAAQALNWSAANGIQIASMSFGGSSYTVDFQNASNNAASAGVYQVAAAGNGGINQGPQYPANFQYVESVAASNNQDKPWSGTNDGADITAAGQDIRMTWRRSTYAMASGTSPATAIVAGVAGLVYPFCTSQWILSCIGNAIDNHAESISTLNNISTGNHRVNARCAVFLPSSCVPSR